MKISGKISLDKSTVFFLLKTEILAKMKFTRWHMAVSVVGG